MTAHRAAWVCHWQSTGQAKTYSVDVGVQQGILCRSTELSALFCGKTAILRQSQVGTLAFCHNSLAFTGLCLEKSESARVPTCSEAQRFDKRRSALMNPRLLLRFPAFRIHSPSDGSAPT